MNERGVMVISNATVYGISMTEKIKIASRKIFQTNINRPNGKNIGSEQ